MEYYNALQNLKKLKKLNKQRKESLKHNSCYCRDLNLLLTKYVKQVSKKIKILKVTGISIEYFKKMKENKLKYKCYRVHKKMIKNAVYLKLLRASMVGGKLWGEFKDLIPTFKKTNFLREEDYQFFIDCEGDEPVKSKTMAMQYEDYSIRPILGLDKKKPIYVLTNGNYYYLGITQNLEEWEKKNEGRSYCVNVYDFSKC